jgi:hypothetical protein
LKVEPELGTGLKPVAEAQGGVAGHGALALNNLGDAVGRDGELS